MNLLELSQEKGLDPRRVSSTKGGEYSSSCPGCGSGEDRFRIWPYVKNKNCTGRYWCRVCEVSGDSIQFCIDYMGSTYLEAIACVGGTKSCKERFPVRNNVLIHDELRPPSTAWQNRAEQILSITQRALMIDWIAPGVLAWLSRRGISLDAVQQFRLGYCSSSVRDDCYRWGIEEKEERQHVFLPKGLVIPTFSPAGQCTRIKIRLDSNKIPNWRYHKIPESMNGYSIFGDVKQNTMIIVESELDAIALASSSARVFAASAGSNLAKPDAYTHFLSSQVPNLWICHDNDEAGLKMLEKWQRLYPHAIARPVPYGKDPGEAVQQGLNLKEWLESFKI